MKKWRSDCAANESYLLTEVGAQAMSTGETTNEHIGVLLGIYSDPLLRIEETNTEWWLGTFSLNKSRASFRVGFGGPLSAQSRFRKQWFDVPEKAL